MTLRVNEIPQKWVEILKVVQEHDPRAVIAGGALRDLDNERSIKDIDIIVSISTCFLSIAQDLGVAAKDVDVTSVESAGQDANFVAEASFRIPNCEWPINIIESLPTLSPIEKTKKNDFGLCQIWFDGKNHWAHCSLREGHLR